MTGLTAWPDVAAVRARLDRLVAAPLRALPAQRVEADRRWFAEHCAGSRRAAEEMARYVPGGSQHNLAFTRPFPLEVVRADGAHLWDVDGNRYVDLLQAGGATVLGTAHPAIASAVAEVLAATGPATGLTHPYEVRLAKLVHDVVPSVQRFRMLGSGTESAMAAVRAARAFTGHAQVLKIGGGYHGWSDQLVYGLRAPGTGPLEATGIPAGVYAGTGEVFPGDVAALRTALADNTGRGGTAAVLVEPVGPESGTWPVTQAYQHAVRDLCDEFGALLVYDEVVSGFRLGLGGAQEFLQITPDLTLFGKCIAGGYPGAGGVGGRQDVMDVFAGGLSAAGERVFVGGTLSASAVSCAAGCAALVEMDRTDAPRRAAQAGDRLTAGLEAIIARHDLPYVAYNLGSIVHLSTSGVLNLDLRDPAAAAQVPARLEALLDVSAALAAQGLITVAGSRLLTSAAVTDAVVDEALGGFERVLAAAA